MNRLKKKKHMTISINQCRKGNTQNPAPIHDKNSQQTRNKEDFPPFDEKKISTPNTYS